VLTGRLRLLWPERLLPYKMLGGSAKQSICDGRTFISEPDISPCTSLQLVISLECEVLVGMNILGLRTHRDHIDWVAIDGAVREDAKLQDQGTLKLPPGQRGASLAWVRQEIGALVAQVRPDCAAICPAEGATANNPLIERAQVDGVVIEALYSNNIPMQVKKSATIRSNFGGNNAKLHTALKELPVMATIKPNSKWRDPATVAISLLPA
jgi:Holliday junction resolvasome RuvABC endonuclease subunit